MDALARGLTHAGHEVLLAASYASTCPVKLAPGIPSCNPASLGSCSDELRHCIASYNAMLDVDIIHDHTLAGPLYRHAPKNIPRVVTAHGPFSPEFRTIYSTAAQDAALIAISHHQASTAPPGIVDAVIHHGIDTSTIPMGQGTGGYACFLGRMDPSKGVLEALDVAAKANMSLLIAAKMHSLTEKTYFNSIIKPRLGKGVDYLGELDAQEKYALLGNAVALVNPIQWDEPFGMVMIEALSVGTPVIATPRGSAPEIIQHGVTGYLETSIDAMAHALHIAPGLSREACRKSITDSFSAEAMVSQHVDVYLQQLNQTPHWLNPVRQEQSTDSRSYPVTAMP